METNATRMCALLVGLPDVTVIGVGDWPGWLRIVVEAPGERPGCCCGGIVHRHGVREIEFVDLPVFGRPARLVWRKQRWRCTTCGRCWCDENTEIGAARCALTTRAARWSTLQVGRNGRAVSDVARDLGCNWHTVMDAVVVIGEQLVDHPDRIGTVTALGFDETLFARVGRFRTQTWSTQIVDVRRGQLLDVVPGRSAPEPCRWLAERDQAVAGPDRVGHARSVRELSHRVRHDAPARHPSRRPVPRRAARQPGTRRVPTSRSERDVRASRPTRRSALPGSASADDRAGTTLR